MQYGFERRIYKYSLGPFPLALAGSVGDLKKLIKLCYHMN